MPLLSRVAVPVVRPELSRNVLVPLLSVLTVPVMRPLASRKVVCADAAVASTSRIVTHRAMALIGHCRACAASGHAAAAPPSVNMNSRRRMWIAIRALPPEVVCMQ